MLLPVPRTLADTADAADLDAVLDAVGETVVVLDSAWRVQTCNAAYLRGLGLSRDEVIGRTPFEFVPGFARSIFFEPIDECRRLRQPVSRIGFSTVLNRWLLARVYPYHDGVVLMANDASAAVIKQQQLAQRVVLDPLTSLGNKLALEQHVAEQLPRQQALTVLVLGIARFRKVNDAHGYAFGDMILLELASRLQSATSTHERLFRVAGDEFAVVVPGSVPDPDIRASALLAAAQRPMVRDGITIVLDASVGSVCSPAHGSQPDLLLQRAALALSDARQRGRGGVVTFRPELELATRQRQQLEAELQVTGDGHQFELHLQPKVDLASGVVCGAEALVRWAHPGRGLLPPSAFLGVAEQIGLMPSLDQWVVRTAIRMGRQLQTEGIDLPISVNLSVASLADPFLALRISEALFDAGLAANRLEVEVPEGALLQDFDAGIETLQGLADMGVRLSVDDFGTGYSSFSYLARLPLHTLKIDRSFVCELTRRDSDRKIVKAIIRMAHSLGLDVVAEGAEDQAQVELLGRMRCDKVQGYAFAKPMPAEEFAMFVKAFGHAAPEDSLAQPSPL